MPALRFAATARWTTRRPPGARPGSPAASPRGAAPAAEVTRLFRCRQTGRPHAIARRTLAMLADIADKYDRTIEFVSVYRVQQGESRTSPHRDARAIDFRIRGVSLTQIRDYLWRNYTEVGIGWYPAQQFLHT